MRELRTRVLKGHRIISGCSEAWYRAWFGTRRPWVQIPPARRELAYSACAALAYEARALTEATERLLSLLDEFSLLPVEGLIPVFAGISFRGLTKSDCF